MTIIKRADLGRPLTWDELDDNFQQVDDLTAAASAAVSSASASATAAASSAAASATSATDAANSAANAVAAIVSAVKSTVTFTTGGTLNSNLDRISDGTYLYYWTGAYPVTVPAGSTVDGTGGVSVGAWACDTDLPLRQELASNAGASNVGTLAGITVEEALTNNHVNAREQWHRSLAEAGLTLVSGSFEEGATVTKATDAVWHIAVGQCYTWDGAFPKTVPANSTTTSTGGVGPSAWVSVGDVTLRSQISDPNGAEVYPELQIARWRDEGDVRGWGAKGDGVTDDTAAICAALDAVNGDYSQLVEYGKNRGRLYIPSGIYKTSTANLTGHHAEIGRFIVRCSIEAEGALPDAEISVLHSRSLNISNLSCKSITFQGVQFIKVDNLDTSGDCILKGSTTFNKPWLSSWGGGSYWNHFSRLRAGTSAGGGKLILNINEGSVNQNTFTQVAGGGVILIGEGSTADGVKYECHQNIFFGVDTSGNAGYVLDNQTPINQHNIVHGLYAEVVGNGRIRGNWSVIGYRCQFGNVASTLGHMNSMMFSEPSSNQQGGDFLSGSITNLCPSGDWSVINAAGAPVDFRAITSGASVGIDPNEPSGCGRWFGYATASEVSYLQVAMLRSGSGYVRGAFYLKGEPLGISIQSEDNTGSFYQDITKFADMGNGWRLYRFAGPVDKTKASRVVISVDAGKSVALGGFVASPYQTSFLPVFCGWDKCKGKAATMPNLSLPPVGFMFYRSSAVNPPTDPTYAWVHKGEGVYSTINVTV